jgi:hypothetical protein
MKLNDILKREKHYRVVIYSKDVVSGTVHDGLYEVSVPDYITDNNEYHIALESFCHIGDAVSAVPAQRVIIPTISISQPDTYNTSSKGNNDALCVLPRSTTASVHVVFQQTISSKTYGIPLTDTSFLRSKQVRIVMKSLADTIHTNTTLGVSNWVMTLVIYPFKK